MFHDTARRRVSAGQILGPALPRTWRTLVLLLRLMLPISLLTGYLRWSGALEALGQVCAPAMGIFRLPGEAAVPMISGMLGGIYALVGAMAVIPMSVEEVTILSAMVLVAHNLFVECAVQDRTGAPWRWTLAIRLAGMIVMGLIVAWSIAGLQAVELPSIGPRIVPGDPRSAVPEAGTFGKFLQGWAVQALYLVIKISLLITAMMVVTEWIRARGILAEMERRSDPLLRFLGLRRPVAFPWLTSQVLGVTLGSGLLIEEMRERSRYDPRDVRALHTSIAISHSLFEDTILVAAMGASLLWITVPRILLAAIAVRAVSRVPHGLRAAPIRPRSTP